MNRVEMLLYVTTYNNIKIRIRLSIHKNILLCYNETYIFEKNI